MIHYEKLRQLLGGGTYEQVKRSHRRCVEEYLADGKTQREEKWTKSIAVGSKGFVESVKSLLGAIGRGRERDSRDAFN